MSKRKFYKTTITVTVLSEDPGVSGYELGTIAREIVDGDLVGSWSGDEKKIDAKECARLLSEVGSDPEFFNLDEDGNDSDAV